MNYHSYFCHLTNAQNVPFMSHGPGWYWKVFIPDLCSVSQSDDWNGSQYTFLQVLKVGKEEVVNQASWVIKFLFWLLNDKVVVPFNFSWIDLYLLDFWDTMLTSFFSCLSSYSFLAPFISPFLPPWPCTWCVHELHPCLLLCVSSQFLMHSFRLLALNTNYMPMTPRLKFPVQLTSSYIQPPTWHCHLGSASNRHLEVLIFPHT